MTASKVRALATEISYSVFLGISQIYMLLNFGLSPDNSSHVNLILTPTRKTLKGRGKCLPPWQKYVPTDLTSGIVYCLILIGVMVYLRKTAKTCHYGSQIYTPEVKTYHQTWYYILLNYCFPPVNFSFLLFLLLIEALFVIAQTGNNLNVLQWVNV